MNTHKIDWYSFYLKRHSPLKYKQEKPFVDFVSSFVKKGSKILECGSGLGRTAAALVHLGGYKVIAIDNNPKLLFMAANMRKNFVLAGDLSFALINIFSLSNCIKSQSIEACTHAGVIEHFSREERIHIINEQLKVTNKIILSIPLLTIFNKNYFSTIPTIPRMLKTKDEWLSEFNSNFQCKNLFEVRQRTDNCFFYLRRK